MNQKQFEVFREHLADRKELIDKADAEFTLDEHCLHFYQLGRKDAKSELSGLVSEMKASLASALHHLRTLVLKYKKARSSQPHLAVLTKTELIGPEKALNNSDELIKKVTHKLRED